MVNALVHRLERGTDTRCTDVNKIVKRAKSTITSVQNTNIATRQGIMGLEMAVTSMNQTYQDQR